MNITLANLESFQEAIKQASKLMKCPSPSERLQLADSMRKGVTCDFFQLQMDEPDDDGRGDADDDEETEEFDENNSPTGEENSKSPC